MIEYDYILRLVVAGALGALIGLEREKRFKEAGLRTHFLVAVGSAIFMLVSKYAFYDVLSEAIILDPSRIAASVVSGIGFLGAGMILVQRTSIHGLTTAAGIWTTAGIGLAIGSGMYQIGIIGGLLVILGHEFLKQMFSPIIPNVYKVTVELETGEAIQMMIDELSAHHFTIKDYQVKVKQSGDTKKYSVHLQLHSKKKWKENDIVRILQKKPEVTKIKL